MSTTKKRTPIYILEKRNKTSHIYDEDVAGEIVNTDHILAPPLVAYISVVLTTLNPRQNQLAPTHNLWVQRQDGVSTL